MLMIFCTMSNYYSFSLSVSLESMSVVSVSFLSIWKDTLFKIQNFPAAATIDPPGGLTAPPQTPLLYYSGSTCHRCPLRCDLTTLPK